GAGTGRGRLPLGDEGVVRPQPALRDPARAGAPGQQGDHHHRSRRRARAPRVEGAWQPRHLDQSPLQVRAQPQLRPERGSHPARSQVVHASRRRREQELHPGARGLLLRVPDAFPFLRATVPRLVPARRHLDRGDGAAARDADAAPSVTETAWVSEAPAETEGRGERLASALRLGGVGVVRGALRAGPPALVTGLARGLGAPGRVRSPSFGLVHEYTGPLPLIHVDLYRLGEREAEGLGLDELLERGALVAEWGERLPVALRQEALELCFAITG